MTRVKIIKEKITSYRPGLCNMNERVMGDSIVTYLPYFGRAYSVPVNLPQVGISLLQQILITPLKAKEKNGILL